MTGKHTACAVLLCGAAALLPRLAGAEPDTDGARTFFVAAAIERASDPELRPRSPYRAGTAQVRAMIAREAERQGVPVDLAQAVAHVESRHRCNAVGPQTRVGRGRGPLQIMPGSAARYGYRGSAAGLANCGDGLRYGMAHLAECYRLAGGNRRATAHCHVQGPGRDPARPVNAYAASYAALVLDAKPIRSGLPGDGWRDRGTVAFLQTDAPWGAQ